jgi:erythromycin esterase-like protein
MVGVYGADLPNRSGSMVPALDKLEQLTAGNAEVKAAIDAIRPVATQISSGWWRGATQKYDPLSAETKEALRTNITQLVELVHRISKDDWAKRVALVLAQNEEMLRLGAFSPESPRDKGMADNTLWIVSRLGNGERAVYWAHNAHVQRVPVQGPPLPPGKFTGAGMRFDAALGKKYYAIATTYGGPAMDDKSAAENGSVDAALERVAKSPFLLSLNGPRSVAVASWLSEERMIRFQTKYLLVPLGKAFDAVAYFDHAVASERVK